MELRKERKESLHSGNESIVDICSNVLCILGMVETSIIILSEINICRTEGLCNELIIPSLNETKPSSISSSILFTVHLHNNTRLHITNDYGLWAIHEDPVSPAPSSALHSVELSPFLEIG